MVCFPSTKKLSRTYPLDCAQGPDNKKFLHETSTGIQYTCQQTTKDHNTYISSSESSYKVNTSISCVKAQHNTNISNFKAKDKKKHKASL